MRRWMVLLASILAVSVIQVVQAQSDNAPANNQSSTNNPAPASNQTPSDESQASNKPQDNSAADTRQVTLPAGTKVLLRLQSPIDTKSAHVGDGVYCQTSFPVTQDNLVAIPAGTYVKGEIMRVERPGRIKGRAELQVRFNSLIYPNGYTLDLPASVDSTPGSGTHTTTDNEGTIKANGQKGKDTGDVAATTAGGAAIGGLATGTLKGVGVGAGIGAGVGLIKVLATRGQDVRLESGTSLEMVLQRPLTLDTTHFDSQNAGVIPRDTNRQANQNRMQNRRRPRLWGLPIP